jgi:hypothetical protein
MNGMTDPCAGLRDVLLDYVDGTLAPADRDAARAHERSCAACAEMIRTVRAQAALLSKLPRPARRRNPAAGSNGRQPGPGPSALSPWRAWTAAAAAGLVGDRLLRRPRGPEASARSASWMSNGGPRLVRAAPRMSRTPASWTLGHQRELGRCDGRNSGRRSSWRASRSGGPRRSPRGRPGPRLLRARGDPAPGTAPASRGGRSPRRPRARRSSTARRTAAACTRSPWCVRRAAGPRHGHPRAAVSPTRISGRRITGSTPGHETIAGRDAERSPARHGALILRIAVDRRNRFVLAFRAGRRRKRLTTPGSNRSRATFRPGPRRRRRNPRRPARSSPGAPATSGSRKATSAA